MTSKTLDSSSAEAGLTVGEDNAGQRIDNFLFSRLKGLPKSRLYRALRSGEVRVNKKRIKADYRLQTGDYVRLPPLRLPQAKEAVAPAAGFLKALENAVIFENNQLIIVNKPAGVAAHGGSGIRLGLIEAFRHLRPKNKYLELVHRLDRETTGCIILAKKPSVLKDLHQQLLEGRVEKTYLALVHGRWQGGARRIDAPLLKNQLSSGERIVKVHPEGKASKTDFKPLQLFAKATLVEAKPKTGRTHQIRVHAVHAGRPIIGDEKYAHDQEPIGKVKHLLLHAASIRFELAGETIAVGACLDAEFQRVLQGLGR